MKIITSFLFFLFFITIAHAQQDSTYSYVYLCDSCGTFETVSFEPIELETNVDISSELLPDTSTSTLVQFSTVSLRKASSPSKVLSANITALNIYPNPVKSNFFVNIESEKVGVVSIHICDLLGRKLLIFDKNLQANMNIFELSTDKLISGNYIIRIFSSTDVFVRKLVVKK